jgi:tetratricopeptide (TPR) repeat protein
MSTVDAAWEARCAGLWREIDAMDPVQFIARIDALAGERRRRANIQLASSLRNLGQSHEALQLLQAELAQPPDELDGAVRGFLALALADLGREREALRESLHALSTYLPRYNRSLARYADDLVEDDDRRKQPEPT